NQFFHVLFQIPLPAFSGTARFPYWQSGLPTGQCSGISETKACQSALYNVTAFHPYLHLLSTMMTLLCLNYSEKIPPFMKWWLNDIILAHCFLKCSKIFLI